MEDRHVLSEPRLKSALPNDNDASLVWLVDIYRKGVDDPIDTIEISDTTLPPRKKKGKVVWRLPSDKSRLPSFPVDERRRILELFKERKKNRRKKGGATKNLPASVGTGSNLTSANSSVSSRDGEGGEGVNGSGGGHNSKEKEIESDITIQTDVISEQSIEEKAQSKVSPQKTEKEKDKLGTGIGSATTNRVVPVEDMNSTSTVSKKKRKKKKMKRQLSQDSDVVEESKKGHETNNGDANGTRLHCPGEDYVIDVQDPPRNHDMGNHMQQQHLHENAPDSPSPPGFNVSMSNLALDEQMQQNTCQSEEPKMDPTSLSMPPSATESWHLPPESRSKKQLLPPTQQIPSQTPQIPPPPPGSRFIVIPEQTRPTLPPPPPVPNAPPQHKASVAVAAAKAFVDIYYPHITHGLTSDLAAYYTPHAQKSISVGGAHSVVAARPDIILQLSSLARSIFVVRGVVSQDTFDGRGAHILVTGVVQTSGVVSQFAHSISLISAEAYGGDGAVSAGVNSRDLFASFQIHNDALSLLTSGDEVLHTSNGVGIARQQQQQLHQWQQQMYDPHQQHPYPQQQQQHSGTLPSQRNLSRPPGLGL